MSMLAPSWRVTLSAFQGAGAAADASILGTISQTVADTVAGEVSGGITLSNIGSADVHCTRVGFTLRPAGACELDASVPCR
jgi:hypothetical protein